MAFAENLSNRNDFQNRFVVSTFRDGAVLVDLQSGCFYRVNQVAAAIARALSLGRSTTTIADELRADFGVDSARALHDIKEMLYHLSSEPDRSGVNPISFTVSEDGYVLRWHEHNVFRLSGDGKQMTCLSHDLSVEIDGATQLLWILPHALMLQGQLVLHASAVAHGDHVSLFFGPSGAGKTTLAHALAQEGRQLISEDLVLVSLERSCPTVILDGEATLRNWVKSNGHSLIPSRKIELLDLNEFVGGNRGLLSNTAFLGPRNPFRSTIHRVSLGPTDAFLRLLENSFAELGTRKVWCAILEMSQSLVRSVPLELLECPDGLAALREAAQRYI